MAIRLLAAEGSIYTGFIRGAKNEVGININRCVVRYYPEINESVPNTVGNTLWQVVSAKFSREITCEGEVLSNTGVMLFTVASALSFVNSTNAFGPNGGTFFMDEATTTASRSGWLSVSIKATARPTL